MATYYLSQYGSDSNLGTSAGASGAWLTLTKALGSAGISSGDVLKICPGFVHVLSASLTPNSSMAAETKIIGDYLNESGFTDGSGNRVPAGRILITQRTATIYESTTANYSITLSNKNYYTWEGIDFEMCSSSAIFSVGGTTNNLVCRNCVIVGNSTGAHQAFYVGGSAGTNYALTIESCWFVGARTSASGVIQAVLARHTADYDTGITIKNCVFVDGASNSVVHISATGSGTGYAGGIKSINNSFYVGSNPFRPASTELSSTTYPCACYNSLIAPLGTATGLIAAVSGQLISNNNWIGASTTYSNVTAGANDVQSLVQYAYRPMVPRQRGRIGIDPVAELLGASLDGAVTIAGWGDDSGGLAPTTDIYGYPRPCGGGNSNSNVLSGSTASAGAAGSITDSGAGWTADAYIGQVCVITSGTGSGQRRRIYDNTTDTLSIAPNWATTPDATSVFDVVNPGSLISIGAIEPVGQSIYKETSTVRTGAACLGMYGPDVAEMDIPVDASATTLSVYVQWNANYGGSNKPQAKLVANPEIGVTAADDTATGSSGSWEELSIGPFTPTAKGFVRIQLVSRDTNGYGQCLWDDIAKA